MKNSFKNISIGKFLLFLFVGASLAFTSSLSFYDEQSEENALTGVTLKNWQIFENTVTKHLKKETNRVANQVYLDFYIDGVKTRVIADNLIERDGKLQIIDAKASARKDLSGKSSLISVCTKNQRVVYPEVNNSKADIEKVIVKGGKELGNINVTIGTNIKNRLHVEDKEGIMFYVTSSPGNYKGTPDDRYMEKE